MFNKFKYVDSYNRNKYKMYQFRVKRDNQIVSYLDTIENKNAYLISLIEKDYQKDILTLKQIKQTIKPILSEYGIKEVYLFGSYSRGEATSKSDVDIYCEEGDVKDLLIMDALIKKLESSLGKKVDLVFTSSHLNEYFYAQMQEDLIKLC